MTLRSEARAVLRALLTTPEAEIRLEAVRLALSLPPARKRRRIAPSTPLAEAGLSPRLRRALERLDVDPSVATVETLSRHGERFLWTAKGVGQVTVNEARRLCADAGLELAP